MDLSLKEIDMNLMEAILGGSGSPLPNLAKKFGVGEDTMSQVLQQYIPALTNGIKRNIQKKKGLDGLLDALNTGNHDRYLNDPNAFEGDEAVDDGNGILGHLLRKKKVSRTLADRTSQKTGLGAGILKKILPLVAGLVMGALKKQGGQSGILGQLLGGGGGSSSGGLGSLTSLLDADGEKSPIDDLLGLAKKLF